MKTTVILLVGMAAMLSKGSVLAQASKAARNEDIQFALDTAASNLGWAGRVESASLFPNETMFMVRDTKGVLAITRYENETAANRAFSTAGGGERTKVHGFDALASADGSTLKWAANALIFTVGSGAGDASGLAESLWRSAAESGLTGKPEAAEPPKTGAATPIAAGISGSMGGTSGSGAASVLEGLVAEYSKQPSEGAAAEAADQAREIYGIDYGKSVCRAAGGDLGELANLFVVSLDGVAGEIHSEVLFRLREGIGPKVFDEHLSRQSEISRNRVNRLLERERERRNLSDSRPPSSPSEPAPTGRAGGPLAGGTFEGKASAGGGEGNSVQDSMNPKDDPAVRSAFPAFLSDEIYQHFQTPAAVTYYYVLDPLFRSGRVSKVGSPEITDGKVSIDFVLDGEKQILWFVEKSLEGDDASVVVGPPNAGGDLVRLRRIDGRWAIMGIEASGGI